MGRHRRSRTAKGEGESDRGRLVAQAENYQPHINSAGGRDGPASGLELAVGIIGGSGNAIPCLAGQKAGDKSVAHQHTDSYPSLHVTRPVRVDSIRTQRPP